MHSQAAFFLPPALFLMGQLFTSSVILSLSAEHRETLLQLCFHTSQDAGQDPV